MLGVPSFWPIFALNAVVLGAATALLLWAPVTDSVRWRHLPTSGSADDEPPSARRTTDRQPGPRGCRSPATMESDLRRSGKYSARVRDGIVGIVRRRRGAYRGSAPCRRGGFDDRPGSGGATQLTT